MMPPETRSNRKSIRTPQSDAPKSRQGGFPPRYLSSSTNRTPSTVPRKKQQTLTQIDFICRDSPERENDLDYIQPNSPPRRKRRRKSKIPVKDDKTLTQINFVRKVQEEENDLLHYDNLKDQAWTLDNSSSIDADKPGGNAPRKRDSKSQQVKRKYGNIASASNGYEIAAKEPMPLPKTPRKIYKSEIASSQSPEDSQASAPSLSPGKSRVALQELPVNVSRNHTSCSEQKMSMDYSRTPLLKVEDTFSPSQKHTVSTWHNASSTPISNSRKIIKSEIEDTDAEPDLNDDDDSGGDVCNPRTSTQTSTNDRTVIRSSGKAEDLEDLSNRGPAESNLISSSRGNTVEEKSVNETQNGPNDTHPRLETSPHLPANKTPLAQSLCEKDSEQASAQLLDNLSHCLLPHAPTMTIETDSQYDAAFRPLWGSDLDDNTSPPRVEDTTRTLIPTSQATTIDATDLTHEVQQKQNISSISAGYSSPKSRLAKESDKVKLHQHAIIPSSPISNPTTQSEKAKWNGEWLTDSQLLPDSIMNFELPPLSTQESQFEQYS